MINYYYWECMDCGHVFRTRSFDPSQPPACRCGSKRLISIKKIQYERYKKIREMK